MGRVFVDIATIVLLLLLVLDVLAVLTLPYAVLTIKSGHGVSIAPVVGLEIVLLLLAAGLSAVLPGHSWYNQPLTVLMYGGALVDAGYAHFVVVLLIAGRERSRRRG